MSKEEIERLKKYIEEKEDQKMILDMEIDELDREINELNSEIDELNNEDKNEKFV